MKVDFKFGNDANATTEDTFKMRFGEGSEAMLFSLLTEKIYSNPIGSIVREITTNCFDSHTEANVNKPVVIRKTHDITTNTHYISFIDFGVGMSPERVRNIYSVYMESSKRDCNTQIGGFGLGGKTPLAYKRYINNTKEYDNSFNVITTYNGNKYHYVIHEGTNSPMVTLLFSEKTKEYNGTEVKIPILENDIAKFVREFENQLFYFENIVFEGFDNYHSKLNDYQIVKGKAFWYRSNGYSDYIHISLGRVAYNLDFSILKLDRYDNEIPVAINLNVGDIEVTPSRENIQYTDETIKLIKEKIEEVKQELKTLQIKQLDSVVSLSDYYNQKKDNKILKLSDNHSISLCGNYFNVSVDDFKNFRYKSLKMPDETILFKMLYNLKRYGEDKRVDGCFITNNVLGITNLNKEGLFHVDGEFNRVLRKQQYLNSIWKRYYILIPISIKNFIYHYVNLYLPNMVISEETKKQLSNLANEVYCIVKKNTANYDNFEVPKDFKPERKSSINVVDKNKRIPYKISSRWGNTMHQTNIKNISKFRGTIVYGFRDDSYKLDRIMEVVNYVFPKSDNIGINSVKSSEHIRKRNKISIIEIGKNNEKYFLLNKNAFHVDQFYQKLLYRKEESIKHYFQYKHIIEKHNMISGFYLRDDIYKINQKFGNRVRKTMNQYVNIKSKIHTNFQYIESYLRKYVDIDKISNCELEKEFDYILEVQEKNKERMELLSISRYTDFTPLVIDVISSVLKF